MELKEFVQELFSLYTNSWNYQNEFTKKRQYLVALDNDKVDFELLMDRIAKYHNDDFMPASAWLREQSKFCYKAEVKRNTKDWIHPKIYDPRYNEIRQIDCFPKGTTEKQIIKTYEKMFPNVTGWQVVEIY